MVDSSKRWADKNAPATIYPNLLSSIAPMPYCSELPVRPLQRDTIVRREQQFRRGHWSRLQWHNWWEKAIVHQTKRPQRPNQRSWSDKIQRPFDVKTQAMEFIRWMCASRRSLKSSPLTLKPFSPVKMNFASVTTWLVCLKQIDCNRGEWRLFIDRSPRSLKTALLHSENMYPSLLLAHLVQLKEEYRSVKILLDTLK